MTIAGVDGFFYAEKLHGCKLFPIFALELSSIFRFLMMYNLLFVPGLKKSGTFFIVSREKSCKKFLFYVKHHYLCG